MLVSVVSDEKTVVGEDAVDVPCISGVAGVDDDKAVVVEDEADVPFISGATVVVTAVVFVESVALAIHVSSSLVVDPRVALPPGAEVVFRICVWWE